MYAMADVIKLFDVVLLFIASVSFYKLLRR